MDFRAIIGMWPTVADFARDVGVDYECARAWKSRNSIQPWHFAAVVAAAHLRGFAFVTNDLLVAAAAKNAPKAKSKKNARRDRMSLAA